MPPPADADPPAARVAWLARPARVLAGVEDAALVVLLALLVALAFGQIALRQLQVSLAWGDPLTRLLVLWVGVLGAVAASRADEHITIDAVSRVLPPRLRLGVGAGTALFASGVCGMLAFQAARFVLFERESGAAGVGLVPEWVAALILPLGFALIAARYAVRAAERLSRLSAPERRP
jgi:TRAP-type C4-dicarboxylate transport system permease small subunit